MSQLAPAPVTGAPEQIDAHEFAHAIHELLETHQNLHTYEIYDPLDLDAFAAGVVAGEAV